MRPTPPPPPPPPRPAPPFLFPSSCHSSFTVDTQSTAHFVPVHSNLAMCASLYWHTIYRKQGKFQEQSCLFLLAQHCLQTGLSCTFSLLSSFFIDAFFLALQGHDTVIVVVMEFCDLGSLMRAVTKKAFKPHGKWSYHTTYVRPSQCASYVLSRQPA